jgi:hypothetical protein
MAVKTVTVKTGEIVSSFPAAIELLVKHGYPQSILGSYIQREGKDGNFEFRSLTPAKTEWIMISVSRDGDIVDHHPRIPAKMRQMAK